MTFLEAIRAGAGLMLGGLGVLIAARIIVNRIASRGALSTTERELIAEIREQTERRRSRHDWPQAG